MSLKNRKRALVGLLVLLLVFGLFSVTYSLINQQFQAIAYLSGCSTFVIALLTVLYVLVTSRQLDVMASQLDEMKRDRELESQPLPWITRVRAVVEKPRLFFSPPENEHSGQARYMVEFIVKNLGAFPAVCVDVSARIAIPNKGVMSFLDATAIRIDALEAQQTHPADDKSRDDFIFASDRNGSLLRALREDKLQKHPHLLLRVLYKNILGACFDLCCEYLLYLREPDHDSVLKNWLAQITSFPIEYKNDLDTLERLKKSDQDRWGKIFDRLKIQFANSLIGKDIELGSWPIPGAFKVRAISEEEYAQHTADLSYGTVLPVGVGCVALEEASDNGT